MFIYKNLLILLASAVYALAADKDDLKMRLLASGGNPLESNYFLPDGTDWSNFSANFTTAHSGILHSRNEETCHQLNGGVRCYQKLSRELWVEPPITTRYEIKECFIGYCEYEAPISPSLARAISIDKINNFTVGDVLATPAQYFKSCKSEPKTLKSRGRYMSTPWYSAITLKIQFKVTFQNGSRLFNQTSYLPIRLENGQCDFIHGDRSVMSQLFKSF